jgi:hypothetical protein
MNEELKHLIERCSIYDSIEELNLEKIKGDVRPGNVVKIEWDDGIIDFGYIFELPGLTVPDEGNVFIHVLSPENLGGIGKSPPVFIHMYDLTTNPQVQKIIVNDCI